MPLLSRKYKLKLNLILNVRIIYILRTRLRKKSIDNRQKDEVAGEVPVAFVVRTEGLELTEEAVKEYIAKQVYIINKF